MPIRWRLTLWFTLMLVAVLMVTGVALYTLLQRYLYSSVDDNLKAYTAQVHGFLLLPGLLSAPLDYSMVHSNLPPVNEFASPGIYIQIVDGAGVTVVKSNNLGDQEMPISPVFIEQGLRGATLTETMAAGDNARVRIMATPLRLPDRTLVLEVGQSLRPMDDIMGHLRWVLVAALFAGAALAAVLGTALARRALEPVGRVTRTARAIEESSDLGQRVAYKGPNDEIGELAGTFDSMIARLDRAFQSQKDFVADASHELRTPLTVIQGNVDLLKRDLSAADRAETVRAIESESKRMSKIVNDLLLLAEVESGQVERRETVRLRPLVAEEAGRARQLAGNRTIAIGRSEDVTVAGDAYRLKQLVGNLVDNAIKYTPEGGKITLSLWREDGEACIEVADTGIGIPPEHIPHMFSRFYRVDKARSRNGGGTGLGLAIVKGIAEQHGGRVTLESQPGKGSRFRIWLKT